MQQGAFDQYVGSALKKERSRFLRFVWTKVLERRKQESARQKIDAGEGDLPENAALSRRQFAIDLVRLRQESKELWSYIRKYFDLSDELLFSTSEDSERWRSRSGPSSTHPSAGLSYLLPVTVVPNHPIFGPTRSGPSVSARALTARFGESAGRRFEQVGIGGIAAQGYPGLMGGSWTDPRSHGGSKLQVVPTRASVDATGKISLVIKVAPADSPVLWSDVAIIDSPNPQS